LRLFCLPGACCSQRLGPRAPASATRALRRGTFALFLLGGLVIAGAPRAQEALRLEDPAAVKALCDSLDPGAALDVPPGDPLQRGQARARREARRELAAVRSYQVLLQPEEFHFDDFDPAAGGLSLHLEDGLGVFGDRVWLALPADERVWLALGEDELRGLVEAHGSRSLWLELDFLLDGGAGEGAICGLQPERTGRVVPRLQVIPLAYRWVGRQREVLASASPEPERGAPSSAGRSAAPRPLAPAVPAAIALEGADGALQAAPAAAAGGSIAALEKGARVRIAMARLLAAEGSPGLPGTQELSLELEGRLGPLLLRCLQERLRALGHPLEASLVVDLEIGAAGEAQNVELQQRLTRDEELTTCTLDRLRQARLPSLVVPGQRLRVPIFYQSEGRW